jgi:hypothetical protein
MVAAISDFICASDRTRGALSSSISDCIDIPNLTELMHEYTRLIDRLSMHNVPSKVDADHTARARHQLE